MRSRTKFWTSGAYQSTRRSPDAAADAGTLSAVLAAVTLTCSASTRSAWNVRPETWTSSQPTTRWCMARAEGGSASVQVLPTNNGKETQATVVFEDGPE